ncbi:hypothetical protein Tsp_05599 [Trichinella spiralis]|uniref:hypothetical protein n=1 Tax=Trichinella spiralis TaxID=6334 RepID=UPI0001EFE190|nr:hypothetical protein Tsp_05599 [Trichinella spiralis]
MSTVEQQLCSTVVNSYLCTICVGKIAAWKRRAQILRFIVFFSFSTKFRSSDDEFEFPTCEVDYFSPPNRILVHWNAIDQSNRKANNNRTSSIKSPTYPAFLDSYLLGRSFATESYYSSCFRHTHFAAIHPNAVLYINSSTSTASKNLK